MERSIEPPVVRTSQRSAPKCPPAAARPHGEIVTDQATLHQTASLKLVKSKSLTFSSGTITASPGPPSSLALTRTGVPSASRLFNMKTGESLNSKFLTARVISPRSIRKVPSRVSPV